MFEQLSAPDHVIAIRFSGKMTGDDIKTYRTILDDKLAKHPHISACFDFTGLADMTGDAFVEGAKADLELFRHIRQFSRCAFISDKEWPRAIISFMSPLFPSFEMKMFAPDRSEDAIGWAAERPEAPETGTPAFLFLSTSKDEVVAFEINGMISAEDMPGIIREFETVLAKHEKVRLLNRMKHFGGIDPAVFMQSELVPMKLAALKKVERYAIVGAPGWMRKLMEMLRPVLPDIDMRTFPADREAEAWTWLGAEPVQ